MVSLFTNVLVFLMSITEDWVSFGIWTICWTKLKTDAPESFGGLQNFTRLSISMNVRRSWLKFHFSGELLSTLEEFGALKSDGLLSLYNYILTLAEGLRRENISGAHIKMTNYCWRSLKCVPPSLPSVHHPPIQVPSWTRHHYPPPPPPPPTPPSHPPPLLHPPPLPVTLPPTPAAPRVSLTSPSGTWHISHLSFSSPLHPLLHLSPPHPSHCLCISVPSFSRYFIYLFYLCFFFFFCLPLPLSEPLPLRPSPLSDTLMCRWWTSFCVPSAPFPPLPLPSSRPTYSTGAHHTCGRAHTRPGAVNALLRRSALYPGLNSRGSVTLPRTGQGGGKSRAAPLLRQRGRLKDKVKSRQVQFDLAFLNWAPVFMLQRRGNPTLTLDSSYLQPVIQHDLIWSRW